MIPPILPRGTIDRRSEPDDRPPSPTSRASEGGKSELRRAVRRVTPGQGNLKDSGTENTQPTAGRKACRAEARKGGGGQW